MRFLLCCLFVFVGAACCFAEEPASSAGLLKYSGTKGSTEDFKRKFDLNTTYYKRKLEFARTKAVSAGEAEEVKKIDSAMNGEYVDDFTSTYAVEARKYYDGKLAEMVRKYIADLEGDVVKVLAAGKTEDAIFIKDQIAFLEQYKVAAVKDESGKVYKKFTVVADKDWQDTHVLLKAGTRIVVETSGTWAPGTAHKSQYISRADADTYNLQLICGGQTVSGGVKWDANISKGGELKARMKPFSRRALSEARGELKVRITLFEPEEKKDVKKQNSEPLETILRNIVYPQTKKQPPEIKKNNTDAGSDNSSDKKAINTDTLVIDASSKGKRSRITLNKGDVVTITAVGTWTPDKDKIAAASADVYQYFVFVDKQRQGSGGQKYSFTASSEGYIRVCPSFVQWVKRKGLIPDGKLNLSITVKRAAAD